MRSSIFSILTIIAISFWGISCSDDLSSIGSSTRPASDGITTKTKVFDINTSTGYRDAIYVRTGYPLLGNITDSEMGSVNAGYLAQFYVSPEFGLNAKTSTDSLVFDILKTSVPEKFGYKWSDYQYTPWDSLCNNDLDSVTLRIYYHTYYGDSLSPMVASAYELNAGLDLEALSKKAFYSDNDFSEYYSEDKLLGSKAYTTANRELSDSVRELSDYMPYIEIKLDDAFKERFFKAAVEAQIARDKNNSHRTQFNDVFKNTEEFREKMFSGMCVKNTFGDGSMLKVYYSAIYFYYRSFHKYDVDGTLLRNEDDTADSTYIMSHVKYMAVTPDVIQMSNYSYTDEAKDSRLQQQDTAYITSPQGYYTILDLPIGQIMNSMIEDPNRVENDSSYFLNGANFYLRAYKPKGTLLNSTPPPYVMMVKESEMNTFFEKGKLPDNTTSCYASFVADSVNINKYYYNFGNINSVILGLAKENGWNKSQNKPMDQNLSIKMAVIPVDLTINSNYGTVLSASNYILPTAVRIRKGENEQPLQMVYTLESTGE